MGFGLLALLLPQAGQAHGGAQLPRLRLLAAGHFECLLKMLLRLLLGSWRVLQQQLTLEPVYLSLVAALPMVLHRFQRLLQRVHALIDLAGFATGLGQHGEEPRPRPKTSCGLPAGKPLAEQGDTLCHLALLRDGPPPWEQAPGPIRPEAMLRTQC